MPGLGKLQKRRQQTVVVLAVSVHTNWHQKLSNSVVEPCSSQLKAEDMCKVQLNRKLYSGKVAAVGKCKPLSVFNYHQSYNCACVQVQDKR